MATGQYASAPSQAFNYDDDGVRERRKNASNEDTHLEEGSGDSEEDTLPNFVKDVNNMVAGVHFANSSSNPSSSSEKRKGFNNVHKRVAKKGFGNGSTIIFAFRLIS